MTTPTSNPVPSQAPQDMVFNVEALDVLINGSALTAAKRLGGTAITWAGLTTQFTDQAAELMAGLNAEVAITETGANRAGAEAAFAGATVQADRAEAAADAVEDSVQYNYLVDNGAALAALTGMTTGQRAFVRDTEHVWNYSGSAWGDTGLAPTASKVNKTVFAAVAGPMPAMVPQIYESLDDIANEFPVLPLRDATNRVYGGIRGSEVFFGGVFETLDPSYGRFLIRDKDGRILFQDSSGDIAPLSAEMLAARGQRLSLDARLSQSMNTYGMPLKKMKHGLERLVRSREKQGARACGDAVQWVVNAPGDSWIARQDFIRPLLDRLIARLGDAGPGWFGMAYFSGTPSNGNIRPDIYTMSRAGAWVDTYFGTVSPDMGSVTSSTAGAKYTFAGPGTPVLNGATLFWIGTSDGVVRYRWNGGAWTNLNVQGSGLQTGAMPGYPASGAWTLEVEVVSGTCTLCGWNGTSAAPGVRINKLGSAGARAGRWIAVDAAQQQAGWAALGADLTMILSGTNDRAANISASQYKAEMTTWIQRTLAAMPSVGGVPASDVLVMVPPQSTEVLTVQMAEYAEAMLNSVDALGVAFLDMQPILGPLPASNYAAKLDPSDGKHLVPATSGRATAEAIYNSLTTL